MAKWRHTYPPLSGTPSWITGLFIFTTQKSEKLGHYF